VTDPENKEGKKYDLEDRTYYFAENCKDVLKRIDKSIHNIE